jgi:hypothetical protein
MQAFTIDIVEMSNDSIKSSNTQIRNMGIASWMCLAVFVLGSYHLSSDGDFSFLMTLSSIFSAFGMAMLCLQLVSSRSLKGVSLKGLQLQTTTFFFRLISTLWHEGYLPLDRSGDFIYRGSEFAALIACLCALSMARSFFFTHDSQADSFGAFGPTGGDRAHFGALWIALPALLLALIVHPSLNASFWSDVAWTFALYLDALAVAPQLLMMHKSGGAVDKYTGHYIFALGFGRVLQLLFWAFSYHELSEHSHGGVAGVFVLLTQVVGSLLMADFFYYYAKSQQKGEPMILPSAAQLV